MPASIRGTADTRANVRFVTGDVRIDHYTSLGNFFFKMSMLAEERQNGTVLTHNSTGLGTASLRYAREFTNDSFSLLGFHTREGFHSSFDSVTTDRNTDRLTTPRPSQRGRRRCGAVAASRGAVECAGRRRRVPRRGHRHGPPGAPGLRVGGGTQLQHGVYGQADVTFGAIRLFAGVRHSFAGDSQFLSPNGGFVVGKKRLRARGSIYRSFRAPTLNELYRTFKAGNTTTEANPALMPETLWGAEAGFDWIGENSTFRVTAYRNALDDLITNVTLSSSATAIVRQRDNAAAAVSRGVEAEFRERMRNLTAS